jgi:hypothetical protein
MEEIEKISHNSPTEPLEVIHIHNMKLSKAVFAIHIKNVGICKGEVYSKIDDPQQLEKAQTFNKKLF